MDITKNILTQYKNKVVSKELAATIVIKFLMQEGLLYKFLEEIKKFKPYKKGNDNAKFLIKYAIGLQFGGTLNDIFLLPHHNDIDAHEMAKWYTVKDKWCGIVGEVVIKPLYEFMLYDEYWK